MKVINTGTSRTKAWIKNVRRSLRVRGYHHEPQFCNVTSNAEPLLTAAKLLGHLFIPHGTENTHPFIPTKPQSSAPAWRPFDRRVPIRWHNDFSTRVGRPELSLSWILREDLNGSDHGAWWVASSAAVIAKLCESREGKRLVAELKERAHPFGYRDAGSWRQFRVIVKGRGSTGTEFLRFYGPALEDGAWLRFGEISERTKNIVAQIEEAANAVRVVLPAKTGSLLIVHNGLSLHDRSPQTVTGPKELRRQALLCFVRRLHHAL